MERTGSVRAIQGGGTGAGFKVPRQVLRFERSQFMNIARPIVAIARSNFAHAKDNQDSLMLIWSKELCERIFLISQRKKEVEQKICSCRSASAIFRYVEHAPNSGSSALDLEVQRGTNPPGAVEKEDQVDDGHISRKKRRCPDGQFTIEKAVPGIPKTVEELVQLWRQGHSRKRTCLRCTSLFVCLVESKQFVDTQTRLGI